LTDTKEAIFFLPRFQDPFLQYFSSPEINLNNMAKRKRISIPVTQRIQRARQRWLPFFVFLAAAYATGFLWTRQPGRNDATGTVEANRYELIAPAAGILTSHGKRYELHSHVSEGVVLARLDDMAPKAELEVLAAQIKQLHQQIIATQTQLKLDEKIRENDRVLEARRFALNIESLRLDILDRKTELETDRIDLLRREEQLALVKRLFQNKADTEFNYLTTKLRRDVAAQRVKYNGESLIEAQKQFNAASKRSAELPTPPPADAHTIVGPIRASIDVIDKQVAVLQIQVKGLEVKSPVSGVIVAVNRLPGQAVQPGDSIFTIADPTARRIITYIRPDQRIHPTVGMPVIVRRRGDKASPAKVAVTHVGPQVEQIPLQQQRDPRIPEWGLPVTLAIPNKLELKPGEPVDLMFP
jgi:multidrug resistance efflux pump